MRFPAHLIAPAITLAAALTCGLAVAGDVQIAAAAPSPTVTAPTFDAGPALPRSPVSCSVDVTRYTQGTSRIDDTAAFTRAMADAVRYHPDCFPHGPSGAPQAVVYVPPGVYRLQNLLFPSNLRMEVDAGAVLQEPRNRPQTPHDFGATMILWDSPNGTNTPLHNVTLIGVGRAWDALKNTTYWGGGAAITRFGLSHDFTMDLDPAATGSTNYNPGMNIVNVQYFAVSNVFSIQNGTNARAANITPWPTSATAVLLIHARRNSPLHGPFLQPRNGIVRNQVNINSPRGFGPNQVNAAYAVRFQNIYSRGGTALRIETDGSMIPSTGLADRGATVNDVTASNIVGKNCNRAVSLSPHAQVNGDVWVTNVWAISCWQAVVARLDPGTHGHTGRFAGAWIAGVQVVGGWSAQQDAETTLWVVGHSMQPVLISRNLGWTPHITVTGVCGSFAVT